MENQNQGRRSSTLGVVVTIAICIVCLAGIYVYWDRGKAVETNPQTEKLDLSNPSITIEDRLSDRAHMIEQDRVLRIYYALPTVTLEMILSKLGSNATISNIVYEYELNKAYYISHQAINGVVFDISGPDSELVDKIEVSTVLKSPDEKDPAVITPSVRDSIN